MANVAITGGAGFLGMRLARELLGAGALDVAGAGPSPLTRLTLADQIPPPADLVEDERVRVLRGDLGELLDHPAVGAELLAGADVIFHLAAAVSGECEADFDLGMRANLRATMALLEACRAQGTRPVVVLASSVAVFGGSAEHPLPAVVDDDTLPNPQSSYGTQKVMCEYLLADYTRKGFIRGRAIRLATVSVRPGQAERGGLGLPVGHHQGAAGGPAGGLPGGPGRAGGAGVAGQGDRGAVPRGDGLGRGVGRPVGDQLAGAVGDGGGDGRGAGAGGRPGGERADRLGPGPGGRPSGGELAGSAALGPGGSPGAGARS